jgi:hypothetical protein
MVIEKFRNTLHKVRKDRERKRMKRNGRGRSRYLIRKFTRRRTGNHPLLGKSGRCRSSDSRVELDGGKNITGIRGGNVDRAAPVQ